MQLQRQDGGFSGGGVMRHCQRCRQELPDGCWCPDDPDEDDEPEEDCGDDGPVGSAA